MFFRTMQCLLAAGVLSGAAVAPAATLGSSNLDFTPGMDTVSRYHPGDEPAWSWPAIPASYRFTVHTAGDLASNGYSLLAAKTDSFGTAGEIAIGAISSEVWKQTTSGNLLFRYRVFNDGTSSISYGNIAAFGPETAVVDCGILDVGGDVAFDQGDILQLGRSRVDPSDPQLEFGFNALTTFKTLQPGQTSQWFYAETESPSYTDGFATLQFGGDAADMLDVYVPIPEPATVGLLGLGGVWLLGRKVRRRA